MTAPAINGTKYPQPVGELLPAARKLADELGEIPSRNRLMTEFRIGAPKATDLRTQLTEENLRRRLPTPVVPESVPLVAPAPAPAPEITPAEPVAEVTPVSHPDTPAPPAPVRSAVVWPVVLLALPAFVAIWSGWVGLGGLTGFGIVHPLPGIWDSFSINSAITLPIGVETYGAYALYVWLSGRVPERARRFAKWSALGSLTIGAAGQVAYHLLDAAGVTSAPWWITTAVACLPVAVLGMGAALAHLVRTHD